MSHKAEHVAGKKALLNEDTCATIDHWVAKFPPEHKRSALIQSLLAAQHQNGGWVSKDMIEAVADYLDLPPVWAFEVASFYSMYELNPVARHNVSVCTNVCCMLMGSDTIVGHLEKKLGIKLGESTADGRIYLKKEEECLAACAGGPMMQINHKYYTDLTPEKLDEIIDGLE